MSLRCVQKLARLSAIVAERVAWEKQLGQVKRMRQWVLDAEHLLSGKWVQAGDVVSNATVGARLDAWREELAKQGTDGTLSERTGIAVSCAMAAPSPMPPGGSKMRPISSN